MVSPSASRRRTCSRRRPCRGGWRLACTAATRLGAGVAYASRLFLAVFAEPPASFDDDRLGTFATDVGLGQEALVAALEDPATAAALQATTQEALQRGAFGVPTFFVGERMYWGNDRLVLLQHHLASLTDQGQSSPDPSLMDRST